MGAFDNEQIELLCEISEKLQRMLDKAPTHRPFGNLASQVKLDFGVDRPVQPVEPLIISATTGALDPRAFVVTVPDDEEWLIHSLMSSFNSAISQRVTWYHTTDGPVFPGGPAWATASPGLRGTMLRYTHAPNSRPVFLKFAPSGFLLRPASNIVVAANIAVPFNATLLINRRKI